MSEQNELNVGSETPTSDVKDPCNNEKDSLVSAKALKKEINGPKGLEPTRYGDWESKGRCYDF